MRGKQLRGILAAMLCAGMLSACGESGSIPSEGQGGKGGTPSEQASTKPQEPVNLTIYTPEARMPEKDFNLLIADPVKKKYPNITVTPIFGGIPKLTELVGAGESPDMVMFWSGELQDLIDLHLMQDLNPLLKKANFDLNRYQPGMLEPSQDEKGALLGLPYHNNVNALFYNKDIFDKFGVPYPKDGMTWDDAIDLAKKVSRTADGVEYSGLNYDNPYRMYAPLSLNQADPKTDKVLVTNDQWKLVISTMKAIRDVPGNKFKNMRNQFMKDKTLAMGGCVIELVPLLEEPTQQGLNWDLAEYPSYKERPHTFGFPDLHELGITTTTKQTDAAMKVMEVFFSDEVQLMNVSQTGRVSPLKDKKFVEQYAKNMPSYVQDKRIDSVFKSHSAPYPTGGVTKYYRKINPVLVKHINQFLDGKVDMNTALRQAEEDMTQTIAAVKGQ
jgi:multiple sugar transport system substrate-binding protein